ncbi:MAG TPA: SCO family protein [Solirubrobacteraceae bacterium]|jgi:protein SCO1/2
MVASSRAQRILFVVLVALLTAIAVVLLIGPASSSTTPIAGSRFDGPTLPAGLRAANFSLTDQSGRRVTLARYRGHVVVLTFIHSLCKDTCPFMVEQIKGALNDLPNAGRGVPAIGVSVEPAQDTDHNRKAFLSRHELTGRLAFVSGPMSVMHRVWHDYAIAPVTPNVDHSTFVLLIDKRGFERIGFAADQLTPEDLAHDIRALERERA